MRAMQVLCGLLASAVLALVVTVSGQAPPASGTAYNPPKTPWAIPTSRGSGPAPTWSACRSSARRSSATGCSSLKRSSRRARSRPRSRPPRRARLRSREAARRDRRAWRRRRRDVAAAALARARPASRQSSLIVDPPDGKMPPMTAEGAARQKTAGGTYTKQTGFKSADELGPYDRCISRGVVGSMMPVVYNNGNQIIQAPGYVAFRNEMIHETRIIPLDGRAVAAADVQVVHGHVARPLGRQHAGRRDDQPQRQDRHAGQRDDADPSDAARARRALHADCSANDPAVRGDDRRPEDLDEAVEGVVSAQRDSDYQMFEYACHEGNYAMRNTLSGSRADEKAPSRVVPCAYPVRD